MLPAISSLIKRNNFSPSDRKLLINISDYIEKTNNVLNVLIEAAPEEFDTLKEIADQLTNIITEEEVDLICDEVFGISSGSGGSGSGVNIIGEI